jgi:hypothetical protein
MDRFLLVGSWMKHKKGKVKLRWLIYGKCYSRMLPWVESRRRAGLLSASSRH